VPIRIALDGHVTTSSFRSDHKRGQLQGCSKIQHSKALPPLFFYNWSKNRVEWSRKV